MCYYMKSEYVKNFWFTKKSKTVCVNRKILLIKKVYTQNMCKKILNN